MDYEILLTQRQVSGSFGACCVMEAGPVCWISTDFPGTAAALFKRTYLRRVVVPIASRAGLAEHYAYLEESLKRFPDGAAQQQLALDAGFREACHRPVAAGLMGLLIVWT